MIERQGEKGLMLEMRHVEALRTWSGLVGNFRPEHSQDRAMPVPFGKSFRGLIEKITNLRNHEYDQITCLANQSTQLLAPLGEPLKYDLGLDRILARAREEAYSDWLQWAFSRMTVCELEQVLGLEGLCDPNTPDEPVCAEREVVVREGHEGRGGRLDLLVKIGNRALLVIEVKITTAEQADTKKQRGYKKSIENHDEFKKRKKHYLLFAIDSKEETIECFCVITYEYICRKMRCLSKKWIKAERKLEAAMLLALTASLEKTLLRMSLDANTFSESTKSHLERFVGECRDE